MKQIDIRRKIGNKIRVIRRQYYNDNERNMTQGEFAKLFNCTDPIDVKVDAQSIGKYERGDVAIPGDKYEKFLSLDKDQK